MTKKRVLVFGAFDPLHEGHRQLFSQAKQLGDTLVVVISRDTDIEEQKGRVPYLSEEIRLQQVQNEPNVDKAYLGDEDPSTYSLLRTLDFDVLAVGYDQRPDDISIQKILRDIGKENVRVVRLEAFKPDQYKSSFFRT